ncbi:lipid A deacylase LpxR family protein [bacterium]|nr:lipid A deacylase LpxR family protein [bacterium]
MLKESGKIQSICAVFSILFLLLNFYGLSSHATISYVADSSEENLIESCPPMGTIEYRGFTIRVENDAFAKTDHNYSHGLAFTSESYNIQNYLRTDCLPLPLRAHKRFFNLITPKIWFANESFNPISSIVIKIGQAIYTPTNPISNELILNDRPYAGLLYVGLSLHQRYFDPEANLEILDAREITLGVIGPLSGAKEFQDIAHDIMGDHRFMGWAHQLTNEPAIQVAWDKKFKNYRGISSTHEGFSADWIRSVGVRLGNIETSFNVGFEGRLGWDIPNDFGSFTIRPGTDSRPPDIVPVQNNKSTADIKNNSPHFGFHFFAITDLKFVGYNFSLNGNVFDGSHSVTHQPVVAFGALGMSFPTIIKRRGYNLAIMQVYQTSDFKERTEHHAYRSIALSVEF